ncbi:glycosyltransferase family 2 protein [Calothrix sp. 336/3]|uniref:glycosyltransferase family 2 protein n=1 Tax=Calothrix sp. 336/3 TaxID=1337936 RepID=UPI0004E35DDF|nr:glycosyltransferase family A protein [Calothrix sp. 336/3]AKG22049.1 glycosyl transferase [Calothrix sp. 336/3]
MKFSIVITTYNRLDLLKRAIASGLQQTMVSEVVVADDCSGDGTEEYVRGLIEELAGDSRLVYHRNQVNLGHSATVNAGVAVSSGDWIKFLDDDDYLASDCIAEMARAIALCPEAVICSCIAAQVNSQGVELSRTPVMGSGLAVYVPQADIHYGMLLELLPFGTPVQVACKREAFLQTGGWDSSLDGNCDDIDCWVRVAEYGGGIFVNRCLAYRTVWSGAYNQKFAIARRLEANILMKEKIYALVNEKYRDRLPPISIIKDYLKLHWILAACKQYKFLSAMSILSPVVLSHSAWRILIFAMFTRHSRKNPDKPDIHQVTIIPNMSNP